MAEYTDQLRFTRVASGDLRTSQFQFVQGGGNKDVYLANSGATFAYVLQNKPNDNEHATCAFLGSTKIRVASSIGPQTEIAVGSGGYAIIAFQVGAVSSGTIQGQLVVGATSGAIGEAILSRR